MADELTPGALDRLLASLGGTGPLVAAALRRRGIKGRSGNACACPLARLLHAAFPGHGFAVSPYAPPGTPDDGTGRVEIDGEGRAILPAACADFALGFDRGEYPDMVDAEGG